MVSSTALSMRIMRPCQIAAFRKRCGEINAWSLSSPAGLCLRRYPILRQGNSIHGQRETTPLCPLHAGTALLVAHTVPGRSFCCVFFRCAGAPVAAAACSQPAPAGIGGFQFARWPAAFAQHQGVGGSCPAFPFMTCLYRFSFERQPVSGLGNRPALGLGDHPWIDRNQTSPLLKASPVTNGCRRVIRPATSVPDRFRYVV